LKVFLITVIHTISYPCPNTPCHTLMRWLAAYYVDVDFTCLSGMGGHTRTNNYYSSHSSSRGFVIREPFYWVLVKGEGIRLPIPPNLYKWHKSQNCDGNKIICWWFCIYSEKLDWNEIWCFPLYRRFSLLIMLSLLIRWRQCSHCITTNMY
jgi:hypothetical protein